MSEEKEKYDIRVAEGHHERSLESGIVILRITCTIPFHFSNSRSLTILELVMKMGGSLGTVDLKVTWKATPPFASTTSVSGFSGSGISTDFLPMSTFPNAALWSVSLLLS